MGRSWRFDVLAGLLAAWGVAGAAPVGVEPPEPGDCEVEIARAWLRDADGITGHAIAAEVLCGVSEGLEWQGEFARERSGPARSDMLALGIEWQLARSPQLAAREWVLSLGLNQELAAEDGRAWRRQDLTVQATGAFALWPGTWFEAGFGLRRERDAGRWRSPWSLALEQDLPELGTWRIEFARVGGEPVLAALAWSGALAEDLELVLFAARAAGRSREREFGMALKFEF